MEFIKNRIKQLREIEVEVAEAGSEKGVQGIDEDIEELERQYMRLVINAEKI